MTATLGFRTRTRGGFTAGALKRFRGPYHSNVAAPSWSVSTALPMGSDETMVDYVTPRFLHGSRQGHIFNRPMSHSKTMRSTTTAGPRLATPLSGGDQLIFELEGPNWTFDSGLSSFAVTAGRARPYAITTVVDQARTRCIANVDKPDFEGLVTLGELGQTLRYLRNPLKTGLTLASTLERKMFGLQAQAKRRGRPSDKLRKDLADLYLEITFGFKPLVKDVSSILEKTREKVNPRAKRITARAREERTYTDSWTSSETVAGSVQYTAEYKYEEKLVVRPYILYENTLQLTAHDEWGVGFSDIPAAAWELVPLSFVVDWFVNVGDLISAITPRVGITYLATGYSVKTERKLTRKVSGYYTPGQPYLTERDGSGVDILFEESYYRVPEIGVPTLALKDLESLKSDIGRLTSILFLLTQKLSNLSRQIPVPQKVTRRSVAVGRRNAWEGVEHL